MGRANLDGMLEVTDRDTALAWHLQSNHYPPVPLTMIPACKKAIENAEDGDWDELVLLPEGVTYRGAVHAPTRMIIEQHHLDGFIQGEDYD